MQDPVSMLEPQVGLMVWTLLPLGVVFATIIYFLLRLLRALERRPASMSAPHPTLATEDALAAEVAQLRTDVTNLAHVQEFTSELLTQRPAQHPSGLQPRGDKTSIHHERLGGEPN